MTTFKNYIIIRYMKDILTKLTTTLIISSIFSISVGIGILTVKILTSEIILMGAISTISFFLLVKILVKTLDKLLKNIEEEINNK